MGVVDVCPKKQVDITAASKKLGCTNDTYGNNRYMCIPKENRASLFEFCYDGNMGIEEGGACLEATFGGIRRYNCSGFMYGCPDIPYHRYNVHKHPACQDINTKQRCYVLDRSCPSQRIDARNEKEMKEEGSSNLITLTAIGVSLFIVLIFAAAIFIWKCYLKKAPVESNLEEAPAQSNHDEEDVDAMAILLQNPENAVLSTVHLPLYKNEGNGSRLNDTVSQNTTFSGNGSRLNDTGSPNTPFSGNGSRLNDTGSSNTPFSGNGSRLNDTGSPNTPFSGNACRLNESVSQNTPFSDSSEQKGAIHSCNTFGTLYKDENIACYEAEEQEKGKKVLIRFKEDKAEKKEDKADKKELPEMLNENAGDFLTGRSHLKQTIQNAHSDMFRLKRDGKLATFKLLYEEDEEQDHDPPRQIGMRPLGDGHSAEPSGNDMQLIDDSHSGKPSGNGVG